MKKYAPRIKWSLVDLTRPAPELAQELGVHVNAVYNARKRLGIEAPNLAGGKPGNNGGGPRYGNQNRKGKTLADSMKPYQLRLHPDLIERIQAEARRTRSTASEVVRLALVAYLHKAEQHGTEEA
jgi:hypothetical protein